MAHPYGHALSSSRKWGGEPEDYLEIHQWFDASKAHYSDFRHRAMRHHSEGIFEMEKVFGPTITIEGKVIPTRIIGEQHVMEDLGWIPNISEWLKHIKPEKWMNKPHKIE
jgi:hypothetical protein